MWQSQTKGDKVKLPYTDAEVQECYDLCFKGVYDEVRGKLIATLVLVHGFRRSLLQKRWTAPRECLYCGHDPDRS